MRHGRRREQGRCFDVQTTMLIWLLAGAGLGVFLTMSLFALIVAFDRRAFGRGMRRAALKVETDGSAMPLVQARPAPALATLAAHVPVPPAAAVPAGIAIDADRPAATSAAPRGAAFRAEAPAVAQTDDAPRAAIAGPQLEAEPAPNVEELFARAFEAAVATTPRPDPERAPGKS